MDGNSYCPGQLLEKICIIQWVYRENMSPEDVHGKTLFRCAARHSIWTQKGCSPTIKFFGAQSVPQSHPVIASYYDIMTHSMALAN